MAYASLWGIVARSLSCGIGRVGRGAKQSRTANGENEVLRAFQAERARAPYNIKSYSSITTVMKKKDIRWGTFTLQSHLANDDCGINLELKLISRSETVDCLLPA